MAYTMLGTSMPAFSADPSENEKVQSTAAETSVEHEEANESGAGLQRGFLRKLVSKVYFWRLHYFFVAQNGANCTLFYGLIQDDPLIGHASVDFTFPNGCTCHGSAQVTHLPKGRSVIGQTGVIKTKCTDGRRITGNFVTTSLTTGKATVKDDQGNEYQATFGQTALEAVESVNALRKKLGCPECSARDVELSVQGKVIPAKSDK